MQYTGVLKKMKTENTSEVNYFLDMWYDFLHMNKLISKKIELSFKTYQCLNCNQEKEIYRQGFCKSCFFKTPTAGDWVMRPELSKAHLNIKDRDLDYEKQVQLQPHIVYLADSSNIKVGVTRKQQIPTRWIDQGANKALEIIEAPNRYLAGITEVALKKHVADKTNWRKMLRNDSDNESLTEWREQLKKFIPEEVKEYFIKNNSETIINFPVKKYPEKPKSLNLKKTKSYKGKLMGIKGQYLIFEDQTVFNIRSNEGLVVQLNIDK